MPRKSSKKPGRVKKEKLPVSVSTLSAPVAAPATMGIEKARQAEDRMLGAILKDLRQQFKGEGLVRRLSEEVYEEVQWVVPTGIEELDFVFGLGGLPLGKLIVIKGLEQAGKSTLCKVLSAAAQRGAVPLKLRTVVPLPPRTPVYPYFQELESSGITARDASLGIDIDRALGTPDGQLDTLEQCFEMQERTLLTIKKHGGLGLGVLDSVVAPPTKAELELDYDEESRRGLRASFFSRNLQRFIHRVCEGGTNGLIFVNQVRANMHMTGAYSKHTSDPGGFALRHYCHVRLEVTRIEMLRRGKEGPIVGVTSKIKCEKNKLAPPFRECLVNIFFDPPRVESASAPVRQAAVL